MNSLSVAGRVGTVRELSHTSSGDAVLNFSIAVDRGKDKQGEKMTPLWVSIALWGKQAESLAPYITKGCAIAAQGQADVRTYPSQGETKAELQLKFARVTLLGGGAAQSGRAAPAEVADEDIPF